MEMNSAMRSSSSDCSSLATQILGGGHSVGVSMGESEGAVIASHHENGPSVNSGRRTSRVWKYFRMVDNCHYVCCLCNFVGAYTNTTNMRKHIQNHHPEIFQDILDHTRPSNRLHYLRPFQTSLFQVPHSATQYQQPFINSTHSYQMGSSSVNITSTNASSSQNYTHQSQYSDSEPVSGNAVDPGDSSYLTPNPQNFFSQRDQYWDKPLEPQKNNSHHKISKTSCKTEFKVDTFEQQTAGEDRKHEGGSGSHSGGTLYPPVMNENSRGSGENHGTCDDVSVPVSPEQFLSEEMEQGGSPHTPSSQRPESYKLRHNNHLMLVLESLAGDESFMDVTLTAQGKAIKAHKSVLSAVSPYFRSVLKENPCQHPIIIMPRDIRFEELNNIISYIYKGEMTVAAEDLSSLLKTAEVLQVTGLSPSDSGNGTSGIMSQMQGIPAGLFSSSHSSGASKKSKQKAPPPPPPPPLQQTSEEGSSEPQGRIDPLEFLNTDLSCVKEEIQSDNDDDDSGFQPPMDVLRPNSSAEPPTTTSSDCTNSSPNRSRSVDESPPSTSENSSSKTFNPEDPGVSLPPEEAPSETTSPSSLATPNVCPYCSETHRPVDALQTHLRLKHPSKAAFVCGCGRVFLRMTLLTEHSKKCKI